MDRPTAWRLPVTGLMDPARSESCCKFLFVHSFNNRNEGGGGRHWQVGGRQAQAPEPEQMPDSEVNAGKSDSEDGAGGLEPGGLIPKTFSFIISKNLSFYIHLYPFISVYIS